MNSQTALHSLLTAHAITWAPVPQTYLTHGGKEKRVISGIPGKVFWLHYKDLTGEARGHLRMAGAWLVRHARGQWEVFVALNPRTIPVICQTLAIDHQTLAPDVEAPNPTPQDQPAALSEPLF